MVHQSLNCVKQRMLAANRNNRFIALVSRTEILCMAQNNGIFQFDYPADCGVPCEVVVDRGNGRVLHMLRCVEVRLAEAQINHVNAGLAQLVGFSDYGHGGRDFNPIDAFGNF